VWLNLEYNTAFLNIFPWLFKIKQLFNMDGVEWQRDKWNRFAKIYLYINYKIAGWLGKTLIADHPKIQKMLRQDFKNKDIVMIPYGSHAIQETTLPDDYGLQPEKYLLVIARLEPENNILPIVRAWSKKPRSMKLVIVGDYLTGTAYQKSVRQAASKDVVFLGPIYNRKIVESLRYNCAFYLHGHTVGGTNPTLLEALGAGSAIFAHDNPFNRWVADKSAIYFKGENDLAKIYDQIELDQLDRTKLKEYARQRHTEQFQWLPVLRAYERLIQSQF
jgi:glycosyltransferase involved in cell wall biosynthesis